MSAINQKMLIAWINEQLNQLKKKNDVMVTRDYVDGYIDAFEELLNVIQSGAFDAPEMENINAYWAREGLIKHQEAEVQRLRAALMDTSLLIEDMAVSRIDDFCRLRDNARAMVAMIHSALSTTTEPINAEKVERVREGDGNA